MFCTCISGGVVTKTLRKRAIKALIFTITLIYLSISVSAVGTFDSEAKVITYKLTGSATNGLSWQDVTTSGSLEYTSGTTTYEFALYNGFKVNQVPQDGYILVCTIVLGNIDKSTVSLKGVGQLTSNTLFSKSGSISSTNLSAIPLNQEIIASTVENYEGQVRLTVTFKSQGFTNQYPVVKWQFKKTNTTLAIPYSDCQLYETIDQAAGSGVTPEEMREVLSSWGQEELIPGIGQAVGDKIEEVVPDAVLDGLDEHDNQLKTEGGSVIESIKEQISETITPYFENTDQIRDAIHGGASGIFGYAGTDAVITLPAARNPLTGNSLMWNEYQIDLGMYYNRLPAVLRQLISALLTLLVSIGVIRELLDTVNTILIHREILGMPDDYLKSWTRKDG